MPVIRTPEDQRQETGLTKSILAGVGSGVCCTYVIAV